MVGMSDPKAHSGARIAVISLHTSPLDQPGTGDSGGMNVYIRAVADRLARRGVAVDVFTRCAGRGVPEVERVGPLNRVIQIPAGPCAPVQKDRLPALIPSFADRIIESAGTAQYDLVHAHYWLSGGPAIAVKEHWGLPLVASFHTLGAVKNRAMPAEPAERLAGERLTIATADRILAPTTMEAEHLVSLYGASPERVRVIPPGVDADAFFPRPKDRARARLGLAGRRVVLFLGRLQPLKGPDLAIRAVAEAIRRDPQASSDVVLAMMGGPSGADGPGYVDRLRRLTFEEGIADRVSFLEPRPHHELPWVYSAAEALLMPSRSESFGLAALEAQACRVPVVASAVGGLRSVVVDGSTGLLPPSEDVAALADRLLAVLRDPDLRGRLAQGARRQARRFSWDDTAEGVLASYRELLPQPIPVAAAG
jgi:D-inositol-3-phosphate glycosyltransferase